MEASLQKRNAIQETLELAIIEIQQSIPELALQTAAEYREIEITDEATYSEAKKAVKNINSFLKQIDDVRKEKKDDALRFGQAVDKTARELREPLEEVKGILSARIKEVDNQKLRDADHEVAIEEYAAHLAHLELKRRADEAEAELRRQQEEQARKEREAQIAREAEERARQAAEAEIQKAKEAQERAEREAKEAAERERQRIQREQQEKAAAEARKAEDERKAREQAPDREKIDAYMEALESVPVPELKDDDFRQRMERFQENLQRLMGNF